MTAPIATTEPLELRAGITWQWRREDLSSDYPATSWVLTYWFKKTGATGANFSVIAAADGDRFAITVPAATTATYTAGDYTWAAIVTSGTDAFEVDSGRLKLLPQYSAATDLDDRTHAEIVLDAIEAVIEGRATKDQEEYTITSGNGAGRSLKRTPLKELLALRNFYRAEVAAEQAAAGNITAKRLLARL